MKNVKQLPRESGIYRVYTNFNNACYIGQSKNIYRRFSSHHIHDYDNKNNSLYNTKFYSAIRKHGLDAFEVEVLELCPVENLNEREIFYIKKFDSYHHGYNSTEGGQSLSPNIHSPETEKKRYETRELNQSLKGENHPRAKLSNEEVILIRQRYIDGEDIKTIYEDYKDKYPSVNVFRHIVLGSTYKEVGNIPNAEQKRYTNAKLTDVQVKEIRKRWQEGNVKLAQLGRDYGLSPSSIRSIVDRKTYKHVN